MSFIFSIEGNIGSGKSTLLEILKNNVHTISNKNIVYVPEPVSEWSTIKDANGETILEKFYADQHKYAFSFQMVAYISRLSLLKRTIRENPDAIIITERSVLTDKEVFAKMLYNEGKIEDVNFKIYLKWFDEFIGEIQVNGLIYVNTNPDKSNERVIKRARCGENIPLEYLEKCHAYHVDWITKLQIPTCIFDGNINFIDSITVGAVDSIYTFIQQCISKHAKNKSCVVK